jgi:cell division protein FtsB
MRQYKKEQHVSQTILKFFAMAGGTLLLFLLSVVVVKAAWGMYGTFKVAVEAREGAEKQLALLKSDEARLSSSVAGYDTSAGVERELRERFGVVKPGEGVIEIVRDQGTSTPQSDAPQNMLTRVFRSLFVW